MRESGEDYLETIYILNEKRAGVHAVDVAEALNYSKPSVTRALRLLKDGGYIEIDINNHIRLTEQGLKKASEIFDRHKTITEFWVLHGVGREKAEKDACLMEHDISDETFERISEWVEQNKKAR